MCVRVFHCASASSNCVVHTAPTQHTIDCISEESQISAREGRGASMKVMCVHIQEEGSSTHNATEQSSPHYSTVANTNSRCLRPHHAPSASCFLSVRKKMEHEESRPRTNKTHDLKHDESGPQKMQWVFWRLEIWGGKEKEGGIFRRLGHIPPSDP